MVVSESNPERNRDQISIDECQANESGVSYFDPKLPLQSVKRDVSQDNIANSQSSSAGS